MKIVEIKNQNLWNNFILKEKGDFLQSWQWAEFQQSLGRKVFLLAGIKDNGKEFKPESLLAEILLIKYPLPFGKSYLYSPHGPLISQSLNPLEVKKVLEDLFSQIKKIAQTEKAIFFRIDPLFFLRDNQWTDLGFKKIKTETSAVSQPILTWQLDISASEEEILSQMKPKTRYNIKLSSRKGVKVYSSIEEEKFEIFWVLLQETAKRDRFSLHPKEHYKKLLEIFKDKALLLFAEYEGEILASILVLFFGKKTAYLHGASSTQHRELMASYLIQWEAIREAKKRGCTKYDFGAISEEPNHPWQGITRFKKGFGGQKIKWPGSYDLIYQPIWYNFYWLGRRLIRRYI
jgi:lipid II:glycine glycyltransferase (peptidoglycan interpeptide bridge formation enzyme)